MQVAGVSVVTSCVTGNGNKLAFVVICDLSFAGICGSFGHARCSKSKLPGDKEHSRAG